MFVIGHNKKLVGDRRERTEVPWFANRNRHCDKPTATNEPCTSLPKQLQIVELCRRIELLKVEYGARRLIGGEERLELVEEMLARA